MRISKKVKRAALAAAMIVLMAGAGMSGQQKAESGEGQDARMAAAAISPEQAGKIALEQVKGGTLVKSEYRAKHGRGRYDMLVVDGDARVELDIDASTGQIMSMERESIESVEYPRNRRGQAVESPGGIDAARAREIALARAGGGTVVEVDKEIKKDGRIVFEIEIVGADRQYDVKLDGQSGAVIEYREKMPKLGDNTRHHG
ncbi:MAG: PepSY domain-containing protein [Planctomycetota bacterium]|jgi:uncharacterized membrane protein YkoI|nr:PepSY domain-containing protein [Planctomycetota bacterium]